MRKLQTWIFGLGFVSFLVSIVFMGGWVGDTLWRAGVAAMLTVIAMRTLWPVEKG